MNGLKPRLRCRKICEWMLIGGQHHHEITVSLLPGQMAVCQVRLTELWPDHAVRVSFMLSLRWYSGGEWRSWAALRPDQAAAWWG
jgi:hypothetical protein